MWQARLSTLVRIIDVDDNGQLIEWLDRSQWAMLRLTQIRSTDATSADCLEPTVGNVGFDPFLPGGSPRDGAGTSTTFARLTRSVSWPPDRGFKRLARQPESLVCSRNQARVRVAARRLSPSLFELRWRQPATAFARNKSEERLRPQASAGGQPPKRPRARSEVENLKGLHRAK
jgi:hypothetical protein